jgi:hypothetical protein
MAQTTEGFGLADQIPCHGTTSTTSLAVSGPKESMAQLVHHLQEPRVEVQRHEMVDNRSGHHSLDESRQYMVSHLCIHFLTTFKWELEKKLSKVVLKLK